MRRKLVLWEKEVGEEDAKEKGLWTRIFKGLFGKTGFLNAGKRSLKKREKERESGSL